MDNAGRDAALLALDQRITALEALATNKAELAKEQADEIQHETVAERAAKTAAAAEALEELEAAQKAAADAQAALGQ